MPGRIKKHFYIDFPGLGETEVFPDNTGVRYGWKKDNGVWRKHVPTKLRFSNTRKTNPNAFDIMAGLELQPCSCNVLPMRIKLECGGTEETLFEGNLYFIDGEWMFDHCAVEVQPRVNDPFECLFRHWETKKNVLNNTGTPLQIANDAGIQQTAKCTLAPVTVTNPNFLDTLESLINTHADGCLSGYEGDDWQVTRHYIRITRGPTHTTFNVSTHWTREIHTLLTPPNGTGWTHVDPGLWTRKIVLHGPTVFYPDDLEFPENEYIKVYNIIRGSLTMDNGRRLRNVIQALFSDCNYPVRSDFFGINPVGDAPYNEAYKYAQQWVHNALVYSTSDIVRAQAYQNALVAEVTLKDLLQDFETFFRTYLYFDYTNQCFRIEHLSHKLKTRLVNLLKKRPEAIRGFNSYTYVKEKLPSKHVFAWEWETKSPDWDKAEIIYPDCYETGNVAESKIKLFHTDLESLISSEIEDINFLKTITLVSVVNGDYLNRAVGDISGTLLLNAGLSWANIVKNLHRWEMPSCSAQVNGVMTDFLSQSARIKQKTFAAPLCCEDILMLDPALDIIRTGLGNGEISDSIEGDLDNGLFEFSIVLPPPINPKADEEALILTISPLDEGPYCTVLPVEFSLQHEPPGGAVITWFFGPDATPANASGAGPHSVLFGSGGEKVVTVTGVFYGETKTEQISVELIVCE